MMSLLIPNSFAERCRKCDRAPRRRHCRPARDVPLLPAARRDARRDALCFDAGDTGGGAAAAERRTPQNDRYTSRRPRKRPMGLRRQC